MEMAVNFFKHNETGENLVMVRDDGDTVWMAPFGQETSMFALSREDFDKQFGEQEEPTTGLASSTHAANALDGEIYAIENEQAQSGDDKARSEELAEAEEKVRLSMGATTDSAGPTSGTTPVSAEGKPTEEAPTRAPRRAARKPEEKSEEGE